MVLLGVPPSLSVASSRHVCFSRLVPPHDNSCCALLSIQMWVDLQAGVSNHCTYSMSDIHVTFSSFCTGDTIRVYGINMKQT